MDETDLFARSFAAGAPLAHRLRPDSWESFAGQERTVHILRSRPVHSMILYGPPGSGKTTLAHLLARNSSFRFVSISAVSSGVKDLRAVIDRAESEMIDGKGILLFIDEIHRFSKSQQDALLHAVESGLIILIGATTENPSFEVIRPLLSRCAIYTLDELHHDALAKILERACKLEPSLLGLRIEKDAQNFMLEVAGGDARRMLRILEAAVELHASGSDNRLLNLADMKSATENAFRDYDKSGENHYDFISAFIKSLRGSDPDAAMLYMAAMLDRGEDPLFIARRMIVFASEDIGNAAPQALNVAMNAFLAGERIGMPEVRIVLAQAVSFLASCPKSCASYRAIDMALKKVQEKAIRIPHHLRNILPPGAKIAEKYKYPHDYSNHYVEQEYMPEGFEKEQFYFPSNEGQEGRLRDRLRYLRPHRKYDAPES